jgi:hypothetical protein
MIVTVGGAGKKIWPFFSTSELGVWKLAAEILGKRISQRLNLMVVVGQ